MISWNERSGLFIGSVEEKEIVFVNELMRYVVGELKVLVEWNELNFFFSFFDLFLDKFVGEDEVKWRVLEIEKWFFWSSFVLLWIDCIFFVKRIWFNDFGVFEFVGFGVWCGVWVKNVRSYIKIFVIFFRVFFFY